MHLQPVFAGCEAVGGAVAEGIFPDGRRPWHGRLPSGTARSEDDLARVCEVIRRFDRQRLP